MTIYWKDGNGRLLEALPEQSRRNLLAFQPCGSNVRIMVPLGTAKGFVPFARMPNGNLMRLTVTAP